MNLKDLTLVDYIDAVDSNMPAPGGGSVAGLVGALGVALARMAGHLSVEKKKFYESSKQKQNKFLLAFKEVVRYKDELVYCIDEDAISYKAVIDAYKTKEKLQIQNALYYAAYVAMDMQNISKHALELIEKLISLCNKNLFSDLEAGAILLVATNEIASFNLKANAYLLEDEDQKNKYLENSKKVLLEATKIKKRIHNKIEKEKNPK